MNAVIVTRVYSSNEYVDDYDLYLVETGGYGASWSKSMSDAKIFSSKASAERHISAAILHNAKAIFTNELMRKVYKVAVGNVGNVDCTDRHNAVSIYKDYVELSKAGVGRVANEPVALFEDDEIIAEYVPEDSLRNGQSPDYTEY